ncbi:hypothetical protein SAMN05216212_0487 [Microbulbifer yueqingensis]|uniref:Uncharacterized protein n=1 Tax=Microbulbifer yueqingensis TaxID=658219 RepID=A0A1G8VAX3_9GAMM|nr:hypothetical protein SAMN05216212_0487 [Microbulbifer yueqingensis]
MGTCSFGTVLLAIATGRREFPSGRKALVRAPWQPALQPGCAEEHSPATCAGNHIQPYIDVSPKVTGTTARDGMAERAMRDGVTQWSLLAETGDANHCKNH